MNEADWRARLLEVVQNASEAEMTGRPSTVREFEQDFIEVEYNDEVNTLRTLANASEETTNQTRIIVRPARDTIQFKFAHRPLADTLYGTPLIQKILEEDVPNRRKFKPEYSIYDRFVIVESPEVTPVQLFPGEISCFWQLTGVYEQDGVFHQRFEQAVPHYDTTPSLSEDTEEYREKRVFHLMNEVSVPCLDCTDGSVEFFPSDEKDGAWAWRCMECGTEHAHTDTINDVLDEVDPMWSRQRIRETIREVGRNAVHA